MAAVLAVYCMALGGKTLVLMAIGFGLSALGDFLLDLPEDKGFLAGLAAFFAAHVAYLYRPLVLCRMDYRGMHCHCPGVPGVFPVAATQSG